MTLSLHPRNRTDWVIPILVLTVLFGFVDHNAEGAALAPNPTLDLNPITGDYPGTGGGGANDPSERTIIFFPTEDPFTPLLADPRQPTSNISFFTFSDKGYGQFNGTFGADLGIVRIESSNQRVQRSIQVGVMGASFSSFALLDSSASLIDADYVIGLPITFRVDRFSARIFFYHESSHTGYNFDKFSGSSPASNFGQEILQITPSWDVNRHLRLYGGFSYRVVGLSYYPTFGDSLILQSGLEVYGNQWKLMSSRPYAAFNLESAGITGYTTSEDFQVGVLFHRPGSYFQIRTAFDLFNGYSPMGDFPFDKETYGSFGVYFDF
ncbi:MAG: DUF1207 domain-containing protein [Leptospirales bacterium]